MSTEMKSAQAAPARPPGGSRRRYRGWLAVVAVVVIAGGGALAWGLGSRAGASHEVPEGGRGAEGQAEPGKGVRVEVVLPRKGGLTRTSTQVGSVHPFEQADLFAKVSGYLKTQDVDIGSRVKKGQVIAEIDDPELVKEAARAAASLAQAKAMVAQAKARVETAVADAKAAVAAVSKARADIGSHTSRRKYRQKELARYRDLFAREAVPQKVVDEYEDHYETTVAEEHAAEAALASTEALRDSARAKVDQAKADLAEAESTVQVGVEVLAKARVLVDYTRITSPYDGVVTARNFFVGDFIRSAEEGAGKPLLTVARTDRMRVVTYVPDRDVPFTDVGDKADVTLDALPGRRFEGQVSRFSYAEEAQSRTMRTEIDLENPDGRLREGMYGVASIVLEADTSRLTIPSGCLAGKSDRGKSSVFVVRQGRARQVPVTVGADDGIRVEILEGLGPDDPVIVNRGEVADGTPVVASRSAGEEGGGSRE